MNKLSYRQKSLIEDAIKVIMLFRNLDIPTATEEVYLSKSFKSMFDRDNTLSDKDTLSSDVLKEFMHTSDFKVEEPVFALSDTDSSIDVYDYISVIEGYREYYKLSRGEVISLFKQHNIFDFLNRRADSLEGAYHTAQVISEYILTRVPVESSSLGNYAQY